MAASAGCTVVQIGTIERNGRSYPEYEVTCDDNRAAIGLLNLLAIDDAIASNVVKDFAAEHARFAKASAGPGKDWRTAFARNLQDAVKSIAYVPDAYQTFRAPEITLEDGRGNCVNVARVMCGAARAAGLRARVMPVMNDEGEITHAATQIDVTGDGKGYAWAETTIDARLGEEPRAAARRLGLLPPAALENRKVRRG